MYSSVCCAQVVKQHEEINYVEFPAKDIETSKAFFRAVFDWSFTDYGPDYTAFADEGIDDKIGGFLKPIFAVSTTNVMH